MMKWFTATRFLIFRHNCIDGGWWQGAAEATSVQPICNFLLFTYWIAVNKASNQWVTSKISWFLFSSNFFFFFNLLNGFGEYIKFGPFFLPLSLWNQQNHFFHRYPNLFLLSILQSLNISRHFYIIFYGFNQIVFL